MKLNSTQLLPQANEKYIFAAAVSAVAAAVFAVAAAAARDIGH